MPNTFKPELLVIPYQIAFDKKLQPLDKNLYGLIYWLWGMKDGKCIVSNEILADLAGSLPNSITNSLTRLEKRKYIKRIYKDTDKLIREEIIPLVSFQRATADEVAKTKLATADEGQNENENDNEANTNRDLSKKNEKRIADRQAVCISSDNPTDQKRKKDFKDIIELFFSSVSETIGVKPKITPADCKILKNHLKDNSSEETKEIVKWYLTTEKFQEYPNLRAALTSHSVNLFRLQMAKENWQSQ